uniref:DUF483 domain-containing protein n=1 Tax=Candidatus Methanomethylicus mesodigestus TaxID=1867258 RepID=A0A7C3J1V8_9CREN
MQEAKGPLSLNRIYRILKDLSMNPSTESINKKYRHFSTFALRISIMFAEDRLFDILPRLETQLEIVRKYAPGVRPALDPYTSSQIGIFSKIDPDAEIGHFLDYPDCCIKSFSEKTRYGIDESHVEELMKLPRQKGEKIFVATAGFIPCSALCKKARTRGLVAILNRSEEENLKSLEGELSMALPHFHPEYQNHYYEIKRI